MGEEWYAGPPGSATVDLGNKLNNSGTMKIDAEKQEEKSALSSLSKGLLLKETTPGHSFTKEQGLLP